MRNGMLLIKSLSKSFRMEDFKGLHNSTKLGSVKGIHSII